MALAISLITLKLPYQVLAETNRQAHNNKMTFSRCCRTELRNVQAIPAISNPSAY